MPPAELGPNAEGFTVCMHVLGRMETAASMICELPADPDLVAAMGALLAFDDSEDPQSVDLQRMLREQDAASFTAAATGLEPQHPLFAKVVAVVEARQAEIGAG